jgi:hypothetical protein
VLTSWAVGFYAGLNLIAWGMIFCFVREMKELTLEELDGAFLFFLSCVLLSPSPSADCPAVSASYRPFPPAQAPFKKDEQLFLLSIVPSSPHRRPSTILCLRKVLNQ